MTAARGRPELDYDTVIAKFADHFVPKRNIIHERACFHKRAQKLSLERAIQIARQSEQIKQHNVSLRSECVVDAMG